MSRLPVTIIGNDPKDIRIENPQKQYVPLVYLRYNNREFIHALFCESVFDAKVIRMFMLGMCRTKENKNDSINVFEKLLTPGKKNINFINRKEFDDVANTAIICPWTLNLVIEWEKNELKEFIAEAKEGRKQSEIKRKNDEEDKGEKQKD